MKDLQQLKSDASAFSQWWLSELVACLPEQLRRMTRIEKATWVVDLDGARMSVFQPSLHGDLKPVSYRLDLTTEAGRPSEVLRQLRERDTEASRLVLRLSGNQVLRKLIKLPLATEENLREVLSFEMDQQTPFKPEQVYSDFQIVERNPATHQLSAQWVLTARGHVDEKLDQLSALGLFPDAIEVEGEAPTSTINLLPPERRRPGKAIWRQLNTLLGVVLALLLLAVIVTPVIQKEWALADLQSQLDAVKKKAEEASALRKEIERLTKETRFLEDKKFSSPVVVTVLNELTKLLPNDTWLYQLDLNGTELLISGETPASSTIIGLIEASPLFENVTFRSPVTQNRTTGGERFNLSAQVVLEKKS